MKIPVFQLEREQSLYENTVDYNLTESGLHPYTLNELLSPEQLNDLQHIVLGYGQTNGSIALRERIAALYPAAAYGPDHVLVTNGSAEANFVACHTLLDEGDEMVMMIPNYMQMWGVVQELGVRPVAFHLREENQWRPDLDELRSVVNPKTKMIAVCNPNNPTGYVLAESEMDAIVEIAASVDAWVYSDEIYRGAELNGVETSSFSGRYDKVLVCAGLSKAYALPGLRLGWLAGPQDVIGNTWAYHDYTSITAGILSHHIGEIALAPTVRAKILSRSRQMLNENLAATLKWVHSHGDLFRFTPPMAGGMAFMHYDLEVNSTELAQWLRTEKSVLIVAGDCYGLDRHFRIGIGAEKSYLLNGLNLIDQALKERFELGV